MTSDHSPPIPPPAPSTCCALVVTFHPPAAAATAIAAVRAQCGGVLVVDNGSRAEELRDIESAGVELVRNVANIGLAAALNQGCRLARERGFEWILFLDQDTEVLSNMVADLHAVWRSHPRPERVGMIGSNHYDELGRLAHARAAGKLFTIVPFVNTSGSMAPLSVFDRVGPFRDDFFIDSIDIEFGYRLEARGLQTLLCLEPTMRHIWGSPRRIRLFGVEIMLTNHSALRRYFIVRNGVYVMTRYLGRFPVRCALKFARVFVNAAIVVCLEGDRWAKARAMAVGIVHGLFGRLGGPPTFLVTPEGSQPLAGG